MSNEKVQAPVAAAAASESTDNDAKARAAMSRGQPPRTAAGPTYSEKQVAEILQRAARLERGRAMQRPQLTLAEVEAIARDAGLDPSLVRVAAQSLEVAEQEHGLGARIVGAPTRMLIERVIDGEITPAAHESLSADLRAAMRGRRSGRFGPPPQVSSVGRSLSLAGNVGRGNLEIDIIPRDGKTLIRIDISTGHLAGGLFGGLMGGVCGGLSPLFFALASQGRMGVAGAAMGLAALWGGVFAVARTIFSTSAKREYRRMEELADKLAERVREELARGP